MITKKAAIAVLAGSLLAGPVATVALTQPASATVTLKGDRLGPGEWLLPGQSLTSGRFKLVQQAQGNLVFYDGTQALWTSPTSGRPGARATMQKEGNLVIYGADNKPLWATPTAGNPGAYLLLPKESGNLVIYSRDNRPLWSTKAAIGKLPSGHVLRPGQVIQSANGRYRLIQQDEGNAVLYDGQKSLFTTPTAGNPGARSIMQPEGNWVVVDRNDKALWTTRTAGNPGAWLAVTNDGRVIIYSADNKPLWSSR
ncbi:D-mannose binding lectin [Nonomuraea solani]|uniref:D-mannose binding lectin n=1 Tax=Nonomuraea solani TaxID=1144553 RepID=A0A1H6EXE7_9ACTN|nr:curculin domain-containing protein [Nonomuraea solani]SEH02558.1 D-mannose binding lectin [Nonomuraea solani]